MGETMFPPWAPFFYAALSRPPELRPGKARASERMCSRARPVQRVQSAEYDPNDRHYDVAVEDAIKRLDGKGAHGETGCFPRAT